MLAIYEIDNIQVTNSRLLKLINYSQGDHPTETISSRACCLKPWWNTAMTRYPWVSYIIKPLSVRKHQTVGNSFLNSMKTCDWLTTCEKFVNISIFFYSWGAIEKLFQNFVHQVSSGFPNTRKQKKHSACDFVLSSVLEPWWNPRTHFWNSISLFYATIFFKRKLYLYFLKWNLERGRKWTIYWIKQTIYSPFWAT